MFTDAEFAHGSRLRDLNRCTLNQSLVRSQGPDGLRSRERRVIIKKFVVAIVFAVCSMLLIGWQCVVRNIVVPGWCHVSCYETVTRQQSDIGLNRITRGMCVMLEKSARFVARLPNMNPVRHGCAHAPITAGWLRLTRNIRDQNLC
jgi:hypothetical protein